MKQKLLKASLLVACSFPSFADSVDDYLNSNNLQVFRSFQTEEMKKAGLEAIFTNGGIVYANREAGVLLTTQGEVLSIDGPELKSDSAPVINEFLKTISNKIVAKASNEQAKIQVFTDISCPACREFHSRLDGYLKSGVTVEFILVAREGRGSKAYQMMSAIEEQEDQLQALEVIMKGGSINSTQQSSFQMALHQQAATTLNVPRTPMIYYKGMDIGNLPPYEISQAIIQVDSMIKDKEVKRVR